jgi:beta-phosphoglucomutase-like phosphatase (HAD superfamily)
VDGHLKRLGLWEYFQAVCCAGDAPLTKPDPGLYLAALKALQVHPEQAVALEDSPNGALAACRAGMFCVTVPTEITRQLPFGEVDLVLESLADLPLAELLTQLEALSRRNGKC